MVFKEFVFEAVLPVAGLAVDPWVGEGVYQRLAARLRALLARKERRFSSCSTSCEIDGTVVRLALFGELGFPSVGRPLPSFWTLMCSFRPVVKTVCAVAGVASEGEEIENVAVGKLAVGADGIEVVIVVYGSHGSECVFV